MVKLSHRSCSQGPYAIFKPLSTLFIHHCLKQILPICRWENCKTLGDFVTCPSKVKQQAGSPERTKQMSLDSSQAQPHSHLAFGKILMELLTSLLPQYTPIAPETFPLLGPYIYIVDPQMPCIPNFTALVSGILQDLLSFPLHLLSKHIGLFSYFCRALSSAFCHPKKHKLWVNEFSPLSVQEII